MKTAITSSIAFLLGLVIGYFIYRMPLIDSINDLKDSNADLRTAKKELEYKLENCKINYKIIASEHFDSENEYQIK